jgi:hypothetical protein
MFYYYVNQYDSVAHSIWRNQHIMHSAFILMNSIGTQKHYIIEDHDDDAVDGYGPGGTSV